MRRNASSSRAGVAMSASAPVPACYSCPMCTFRAPSLAMNLSHLRLVHANEPRFVVQCGIGGCSYTAKSFSALYSHIYRKHSDSGVIQKRRTATANTSPHSSQVALERCAEELRETVIQQPDGQEMGLSKHAHMCV